MASTSALATNTFATVFVPDPLRAPLAHLYSKWERAGSAPAGTQVNTSSAGAPL